MFITIYAGGIPFNGETIPTGKSLGGSESAAYYIAKELAAIGHTITVFTSHRQGGMWDGVRYEWHGEPTEQSPLGRRFAFAMQAPQDVVIIQRHPRAFEAAPNSKLNIWWLHDLALHRFTPNIQNSLVNTDLAFTVSEFHKRQVHDVYGIQKENIVATKNGVDYDRIEEILTHSPARNEKHLCFASRPERGLNELVGENGIMEMLPDYTLHVCGYDNTTREMESVYRYLFDRCQKLPNVHVHGHLGKDQLYNLLASCQAYVYPTMFEDTSNIMALESAACGTPFIGIKNGAVPETCASGFAKLIKPIKKQVNRKKFANAVRYVCEHHETWKALHEKAVAHRQSWVDIAVSWDEIFRSALREKSKSHTALIKHYEQVSDIAALRDFTNTENIKKVLPYFKDNYRFLLENKFAEHYKAYYEYEKNRGVEYGPESLDGNPRFECISDIVKSAKPKTVLDYGCAHGHYTINLAKRMPDTFFTGVDLAQSNIEIAKKWAKEEKIESYLFTWGDHTDVWAKHDLVIAAEVLEHVKDPGKVVDALLDRLNPGGTMVISVPYGPWEAIGYKEHKGWRAHIHHLERQDLKEMFGHFDNYKCLALPHAHGLGSYVLSFSKPDDGRKCGKINYARKHEQQAPRQTLSVCMIAKNEEDNIGRSIKSIAEYADEIIVGVDSSTTDATWVVLRELRLRLGSKVKPFFISEVVGDKGIGFAEARNQTIDLAQMDWILWIDADETLENAHLLPFYLRNNNFDAYMINQHHYSAEPAQLLQTDLPCRIFRNKSNVKFFGEVHEHPSLMEDMNLGFRSVYQVPNIHIMHTGYATEMKRRKRFARNFPLLQKDRMKNPGRALGRFLFVRDLAHFIRYEREQAQGISETMVQSAKEAIFLWREMLDSDQPTRYTIDAIPYYSECVNILPGNGGFPFSATITGIEIDGVFDSARSIRKLIAKVTEAQTDIFTKKYF